MSPSNPESTPWLTPTEESAWRAYMGLSLQMTFEMNRQLTEEHGLSLADYSVLVALADSPDGRRRVNEIVAVPGRVEADVIEVEPIFQSDGDSLRRTTGTVTRVERFNLVGIDVHQLLAPGDE